ncbi:MAG TPA: Nudix family hydrolase [Rhodanobacteraceae bacterium]
MKVDQIIEVAAGILTDAQGRVLLMQRLPGKHLAGLWEFPGGKVEPPETIARALVRELDEELGVEVLDSTPLISIPWHYPEKFVRLHALRVTAWKGEPRAREGHPLRWLAPCDMDAAEMPAADAPILVALRLPPYYVISEKGSESFLRHRFDLESVNPKNDSDPFSAWRVMEDTATNVLWQLRMPGATRKEVKYMTERAIAAGPHARESLLVNHDIELARELRIGVHLRASQLRELRERPLPRNAWVGASCHDAKELELAAQLGADFATLSPVNTTASHPGAEPLGWERFAHWVADARLPVYALGGIGPDDLDRALAAGAQGVAGIRAFL